MGCTGMQYQDTITSVIISYGIEEIGEATFMGTVALTAISIPDSVTRIDHAAFYDCTALTTVNYTGTEEQWKSITKGSYNSSLTSATIAYNYKG